MVEASLKVGPTRTEDGEVPLKEVLLEGLGKVHWCGVLQLNSLSHQPLHGCKEQVLQYIIHMIHVNCELYVFVETFSPPLLVIGLYVKFHLIYLDSSCCTSSPY